MKVCCGLNFGKSQLQKLRNLLLSTSEFKLSSDLKQKELRRNQQFCGFGRIIFSRIQTVKSKSEPNRIEQSGELWKIHIRRQSIDQIWTKKIEIFHLIKVCGSVLSKIYTFSKNVQTSSDISFCPKNTLYGSIDRILFVF